MWKVHNHFLQVSKVGRPSEVEKPPKEMDTKAVRGPRGRPRKKNGPSAKKAMERTQMIRTANTIMRY